MGKREGRVPGAGEGQAEGGRGQGPGRARAKHRAFGRLKKSFARPCLPRCNAQVT